MWLNMFISFLTVVFLPQKLFLTNLFLQAASTVCIRRTFTMQFNSARTGLKKWLGIPPGVAFF